MGSVNVDKRFYVSFTGLDIDPSSFFFFTFVALILVAVLVVFLEYSPPFYRPPSPQLDPERAPLINEERQSPQ